MSTDSKVNTTYFIIYQHWVGNINIVNQKVHLNWRKDVDFITIMRTIRRFWFVYNCYVVMKKPFFLFCIQMEGWTLFCKLWIILMEEFWQSADKKNLLRCLLVGIKTNVNLTLIWYNSMWQSQHFTCINKNVHFKNQVKDKQYRYMHRQTRGSTILS